MNIFKLVGSIFIDTEKAIDSLNKTSEQTDKLSDKLKNGIGTAGKLAAGLGGAAVAAGAFLLKEATQASESLDAIQKGAQMMEMSYGTYQELSYALDRSGASINDLKKGMENIKGDLMDFSNGAENASETYDQLGVSLADASGNMRSTEAVMQDTLMALADMDDTMERDRIASELFGKSYTNLIPMLEGGSEGIKDLMQNAEDLGLVMDDAAVDSGANFGDMLADLQDSFGAIITKLAVQLFPIIMEIMDFIMAHMPEIQAFLTEFFNVCGELVSALMIVIKAIWPVLDELWNNFVYPLIKTILEVIEFVFSGGIKKSLDDLLTKLNNWWTKATEPFRKFGKAVGDIWQSIKEVFKLPHFTVSGSLNPLDWFKGGMPKIGVEWYAKGGIIDDPTVIGVNGNNFMVAGEAGAEAVAPVSELQKYIIDAVADRDDRTAELLEVVVQLLRTYLPDCANGMDADAIYGMVNRKANQSSYGTLKFKGGY